MIYNQRRTISITFKSAVYCSPSLQSHSLSIQLPLQIIVCAYSTQSHSLSILRDLVTCRLHASSSFLGICSKTLLFSTYIFKYFRYIALVFKIAIMITGTSQFYLCSEALLSKYQTTSSSILSIHRILIFIYRAALDAIFFLH